MVGEVNLSLPIPSHVSLTAGIKSSSNSCCYLREGNRDASPACNGR